MNNEGNYEGRQGSLISETIDDCRQGRIDFPRLVNDLDSLWNAWSAAPDQWRQSFRGSWWTLEQLLAVGRDRGDLAGMLTTNHQAVEEALVVLRRLADMAVAISNPDV